MIKNKTGAVNHQHLFLEAKGEWGIVPPKHTGTKLVYGDRARKLEDAYYAKRSAAAS
jgi:hypothetical protein